jgi:hypothetical protein
MMKLGPMLLILAFAAVPSHAATIRVSASDFQGSSRIARSAPDAFLDRDNGDDSRADDFESAALAASLHASGSTPAGAKVHKFYSVGDANVDVVPEPSSIVLLVTGLLAVIFVAKMKSPGV